MNLERFVVVAGTPGVHKLITTRGNGIIVEDTVQKKTRFLSIRQNQVTPLGTIGIYTDTDKGQDTISLAEVFGRMLEQMEESPLPDLTSANSADLRAYFTKVVPEHDQDRVHINDIKKCVKWFGYMQQTGLLAEAQQAEPTEAESDTQE
jgi:hypothetical protein